MKKNDKKLTPKERKKLFEEQIANRFLSVLTLKGARWVKEWKGPSMAPINGITGRKYKGINQFWLALVAMSYNSDDPRWYTFNQIADYKGIYHKDAKWHLKEGSKASYVEFYFPYDTVEKKNLTWKEYHKLIKDDGRDPEDFYLKSRYTPVYNGCQIEGIEPYVAEFKTYDSHPNETVLDLAQKMDVVIAYDAIKCPCYSPPDDKVHMPKAEYYFSSVALAGDTLHELTHASGAANRLNRPGIVDYIISRHDERYAYEELIAEIGSCLLCYNLGIEESEENIKNHEAYVASWVNHIKEKPQALTNAIKEAQKACDYMTALLDDSESPPVDGSEEVLIDVA